MLSANIRKLWQLRERLIFAICTPLMSRDHRLTQAGEMALLMLQEALIDLTTQCTLCAPTTLLELSHWVYGLHLANHNM